MTTAELLSLADDLSTWWDRLALPPTTTARPADPDCETCSGTGGVSWTFRGPARLEDGWAYECDTLCHCVRRWDATEVCDHVSADGDCDCPKAHRCGCLPCDSDLGEWQPRATCVPCRQAVAAAARVEEGAPCAK